MQKLFRCVVLAGLVAAAPSVVSAGDLKLSLTNGRVTIIADDVPVRQILAEWARVGRTTVVNAEKLAGPSVTLQLIDVPEAQALETLLRSASGYVVAQRAAFVPGASAYDRILILPTSRAPATSANPAPPAFNQPARPMPQPMPDDDDPADAPVVMPPGMAPQPGPANVSPNPGFQPNQPAGMPNNQPMTSPRPGILPANPGGPGGPGGPPNPYGVAQPGATQPVIIRPPGGPGGEGAIDR